MPNWIQGVQVGGKSLSKIDFPENVKKRIWSQPASAKLGSRGPSWEQKTTTNRSKNGVQEGVPPGREFFRILVGFSTQVGGQNSIKNNKTIILTMISRMTSKISRFGSNKNPQMAPKPDAWKARLVQVRVQNRPGAALKPLSQKKSQNRANLAPKIEPRWP